MAKTKNSKRGKGSYAAYKADNRMNNNKEAKLKRHLKNYPNDPVAKEALKQAHTKKFKSPASKRGNFPDQKVYVIVDKAGHKVLMPEFSPYKDQ